MLTPCMCRKLAQKAGFFCCQNEEYFEQKNKKTWTMWDRKTTQMKLKNKSKQLKCNNNKK